MKFASSLKKRLSLWYTAKICKCAFKKGKELPSERTIGIFLCLFPSFPFHDKIAVFSIFFK